LHPCGYLFNNISLVFQAWVRASSLIATTALSVDFFLL